MARMKRAQLKTRARRERIRLEKHRRHSRPRFERLIQHLGIPELEEESPAPDFPDLELPSQFASERALLDFHEAMEGHDFEDLEDANRFLDTLLGPGLEQTLAGKPRSRKRQAQNLAFDALEASDFHFRRHLAQKALSLDPDCVDALCALATCTATSREDYIRQLRAAVETGERSLGDEYFEEYRGEFWRQIETRPYMRARFDVACELMNAGRLEEAILHMEALLDLNPNDNQGMRDYLLPCYFRAGDLAGARSLLDRYESDVFAVFVWGRVLERFLSGGQNAAGAALAKARSANPHPEPYLSGLRLLPRSYPDHYTFGKESEGLYCARQLVPAWQSNPAAIEWLAEQGSR